MTLPMIKILYDKCMTLEEMKKLDHHAIHAYGLPVELMMENAGLHLAILKAFKQI